MKMIRYLLRISFRSYTSTLIMLLFSIVVAIFCMNVILGYAETYYRNGKRGNTYTTITLAGMDEKTQNTDLLAELREYGATTALYICRSEDHAVLIGFDGTDGANNWWPDMAGAFVNNYEGKEYPYVVYLSDYEARQYALGEAFKLDGENYCFIGYGWIVPTNITRCISVSSPQNVFTRNANPVGELYEEDITRWFRVIPYDAFQKSYKPDLVLIHFPELNYGEMLKVTEKVREIHPQCTVTPPPMNSDKLFQQALQIMWRFIPLFVILTEITLVLSICELYKKLWMEGYVCRICGISRQKLTVYFISEVAILFILGSGIALGLQASLHVPLSALDVGSLPAVENAAAGSLILFGISILLSSPMLIRVLRLQRSEGE